MSSFPGSQWWIAKLEHLIARHGRERVADKLVCLEYFPYHSRNIGYLGTVLESQRYNFHLVREGMRRGAVIVVMRSLRKWLDAVPELARYRYFTPRSAQQAKISPRNLPSGYAEIERRLATRTHRTV